MCLKAFHSLLGVGSNRLLGLVNGKIDMRRRHPGAAPSQTVEQHDDTPSWFEPVMLPYSAVAGVPAAPVDTPQKRVVSTFLAELYQSAAEPLPEFAIDTDWLDTDMAKDWASMLQSDISARGPMGLSNLVMDVQGLPVRFLPPGCPRDLYWQFLSWCDTLSEEVGGLTSGSSGLTLASDCKTSFTVPSWSTFWRTWHDEWHHILKFRQNSQHTRCNKCHELEMLMRTSRGNFQEKLVIAKNMRDHLRDQFIDRNIYQTTRWLSRNDPGQGVMTIIVDGMDKSKFRLPRYGIHKLPKFLEKHHRPHLTCMACICHGWATNICLADENIDTGGNMMCEIVLRMVSRVIDMCVTMNRPFPKHIVIVTDNTVALAKNSVTFNLLALLTSRGLASTINLWNLREGHTHEDIGSSWIHKG